MTNNTVRRGQIIVSKQLGSVGIEINSLTRSTSYILSLGNTVGHYPFGFNVLFLSKNTEIRICLL
jgi:hypothetical protein